MQTYSVRVFELPKAGEPGPVRRAGTVEIQASSVDGALAAARARLTTGAASVRSVTHGPKGLIAYVVRG